MSPADGDYASGPLTLKVEISPRDTPVKSLSLFADGRLLCTVETPPFECPWDAGREVVAHALRAVAVLGDGRRVARSIRTKGVAYTEAVDVDVVHVTATVTDGDGRFVRGLPRQRFRVVEDNVPQEITYFAAENVPLEIIVAVDVSGSMTDAMPQLKQATKKFLSALRPTDRVTLIGFNDNVFTLARPGADLATRLRAVDRLAPWGGTALYDVVVQAIDQLGRQPGRRVLVVFTDGEDLNSHVSVRGGGGPARSQRRGALPDRPGPRGRVAAAQGDPGAAGSKDGRPRVLPGGRATGGRVRRDPGGTVQPVPARVRPEERRPDWRLAHRQRGGVRSGAEACAPGRDTD